MQPSEKNYLVKNGFRGEHAVDDEVEDPEPCNHIHQRDGDHSSKTKCSQGHEGAIMKIQY